MCMDRGVVHGCVRGREEWQVRGVVGVEVDIRCGVGGSRQREKGGRRRVGGTYLGYSWKHLVWMVAGGGLGLPLVRGGVMFLVLVPWCLACAF